MTATSDRRQVRNGKRSPREQLRLSLLRLIAAGIPASRSASPMPRRVLVIRPDHIGDVLFTTPALHGLRAAFPEAQVAVLVGSWAAPVVERNANVDTVLRCPFPWFDRRPKPSLWDPYWILLCESRRLRPFSFDAALILRFDHWWGALLATLAGIPIRIGYNTPETRPFLNPALPYSAEHHAVEGNLALVAALAETAGRPIPAVDRRLEFRVTQDEETFARTFLEQRGYSADHLLIGLHPGAGDPTKLWPADRWAAVADRLVEVTEAEILITGGPQDRELASAIARQMREPPILAAGETTLGQAAALLGHCRLAVGADTGPMHLAVAVGRPTVHLWGSFDPVLFGPWGDPDRHRIVRATSALIRDITIDQVVATALSVLRQTDIRGNLAVASSDLSSAKENICR